MQEIFIKLEGIKGECKQSKHQEWIDVLHFNYKVTQSAALATGGGGGVGKADFRPLTFYHYIDIASPNLLKYCALGKHIPTVVLSACKAGGGSQEFLKITLHDALIVDVGPDGSSGGQTTERVSLAYSRIDVAIKEQKTTGDLGAEVCGNWNVKENKEC
jgi:type VI secretion system secreted protein Hcp